MLNPVAVGFSLVVLGYALRAWTLVVLRRHGIQSDEQLGTTVRPWSYATEGPYGMTRHPIYLAALLLIAGAGLIALGWPGVLLALPALPHFMFRAAQENALRHRVEESARVQLDRDLALRNSRAFGLAERQADAYEVAAELCMNPVYDGWSTMSFGYCEQPHGHDGPCSHSNMRSRPDAAA